MSPSFRSFAALVSLCSLLLSSLLPMVSLASTGQNYRDTSMAICSASTAAGLLGTSSTLPAGHIGHSDCHHCCQMHGVAALTSDNLNNYYHRASFYYVASLTLRYPPSFPPREDSRARAPPASELS